MNETEEKRYNIRGELITDEYEEPDKDPLYVPWEKHMRKWVKEGKGEKVNLHGHVISDEFDSEDDAREEERWPADVQNKIVRDYSNYSLFDTGVNIHHAMFKGYYDGKIGKNDRYHKPDR